MVVRRLVPKAIRRRYAVKFGIALLILGLSVGAIGLIATTAITAEVEERAHDDQAAFASTQANSLEQWTRGHEGTLNLITQTDIGELDDPDAIEDQLVRWHSHLDTETFAITYVDLETDEVVASSSPAHRDAAPEELTGGDGDLYDEVDEDTMMVSSPFVGTNVVGDESAVMSYVVSPEGDENGAVVYSADFDLALGQLDGGETSLTLVLDENNEVVADSAGLGENYGMLGESYHDDQLVVDARRGPTVRTDVDGALAADDYGFDAEEYVVTGSRVAGTDWVVLVHESTDDAYGFVQTVDEYGTYATLGGVLLIGLVGAVLGRNTSVSIDRLTEKAQQMEAGDLDVDLETKRIDNIGRLYDGFDSMREALREQIDEAERERERVQQINSRLERKANEFSATMEAAAQGDLTSRMDAETENEAMETIGTEFNEMLAEIERTVADLNQFATNVATASEEVTASSEEVRSASEQVTESVQEISAGASRQNDALQSVNQEMNGLSTTTEQIAASSNQVADVAERTSRTGQAGQRAAQRAVDAMAGIEDESSAAVEEIRELEAEVEQIDELITTISDIAQQTNMLALNANIEASRSAGGGGGGEGFSAVAKQVKELSEDVEDAAKAAEQRLQAIRSQTLESAAEVEQTSAQIENASEEVEQAVDALEEIAEFAQETNDGVQEISAATQQQAATTQEVVAMVDDAAAISEEATAEAQHVAAAAEEQTSSMTEVSSSASDLATKASDLSAALDRFELDEAVTGRDPDSEADDSIVAEAVGDHGGDGDAVIDPPLGQVTQDDQGGPLEALSRDDDDDGGAGGGETDDDDTDEGDSDGGPDDEPVALGAPDDADGIGDEGDDTTETDEEIFTFGEADDDH